MHRGDQRSAVTRIEQDRPGDADRQLARALGESEQPRQHLLTQRGGPLDDGPSQPRQRHEHAADQQHHSSADDRAWRGIEGGVRLGACKDSCGDEQHDVHDEGDRLPHAHGGEGDGTLQTLTLQEPRIERRAPHGGRRDE